MNLRPATLSDIAFIMACERRPGYEPHVGRWPEDKHRATLVDPNHRYFIGEVDGALVGFVILRDFEAGTDSLYLKRIAVHETDKGHGRALLGAVTDWVFANTRFHRFWLEVVDGNGRAIHVYRTLGWVQEGIVREAFAEPDGTRGSYLQLSILKPEWEKRQTTPRHTQNGLRNGPQNNLLLNQVTVSATDIEVSTRFYETLGFKLIVHSPHYRRFEVGDGTDTFSLHIADSAEGAARGPHIYFECADLDARVAALKAKGIVFESDPVDQSWLWREAWLTDPAGNRLCFYWAGDARRYPPWRVN
ncbi:MAG: GNAT family N-acetyltransferase [Alphaproteobacteria bacterium]|nr:GNAT family N-acetyltransferase [Alphaproteobacteria bacterium]